MQKNIITQIFTKIKDYLKNKVENKSKKLTIYDLDLKVGDEVNTEDYSFRVLEKYSIENKNDPKLYTTYCHVIMLRVNYPDINLLEGERYILTLFKIDDWTDEIVYFFNSDKSSEAKFLTYNSGTESHLLIRDFNTDWENG